MCRKLSLVVQCMTVTILAAVSASAQPGIEFGIKGGLGMATQSTENTGLVSTTRSPIGDFFDTLDYDDDYAARSITTPQISAFVTIPLSSVFSIQSELSLVRKGVKVEGSGIYQYPGGGSESHGISQTISMSYIEIPVLAKIRIPAWEGVRPSIFAGPAIALNISGQNNYAATYSAIQNGDTVLVIRYSESRGINNLKNIDAGLVLGTDLWISTGSSGIVLDIRYCWGTSEVFEDVYDYNDVSPGEYPVAHFGTGKASDAKNRTLSITIGFSFPV